MDTGALGLGLMYKSYLGVESCSKLENNDIALCGQIG